MELQTELINNIEASDQKNKTIHINCFYNDIIKRAIDFIAALPLLLLMLPVICIFAVILKIDSRGPVFYRPLRGGYKNKPFRIFKFRTMVQDADKIGGGTTALNDARITRVGKILRKIKFDEIPQLLNILKGDMSFVGPRPELLQYTEVYTGLEKCILQVRPGITDISSIKFISLDEIVGSENADENYEKYILKKKNAMRIEYVQRQSLWLDARLFFTTISSVFVKMYRLLLKKSEKVNLNKTEKSVTLN